MNNAAKTTAKKNTKARYWGKLIKPGMTIEERREVMSRFLASHGIS